MRRIRDSQQQLVADLDCPRLSQRKLSSILRGVRVLHDYQARHIEKAQCMPFGSLDFAPSRALKDIWRKYRSLTPNEQQILDEILKFYWNSVRPAGDKPFVDK